MPGTVCPIRNRLLRLAPAAELEALQALFERGPLALDEIVVAANRPVEHVHFVESGTVSMITVMDDWTQIEVGLVGPEGFVGLPALLGSPTSPLEGLVQVGGESLRMAAGVFLEALAGLPGLRGLLLRYVDAFHVQVSQSAACNVRHNIEQRLARWMLMAHDRSDKDSFAMTQEFLSHMLGVQRPGVTLALGTLRRAGLIRQERGQLTVLDRPGLEAAACECYATVQQRFEWLMRPGGERSTSN